MLIDRARLNAPVAYGVVMQQLGLNNEIKEHRDILSDELAAISRLEHSKGRPMLSAMAMYEGLKSFGPAFYPLAEDLGYGDAAELERKKFAHKMQKQCNEYWKNAKHYNAFVNDTSEVSTAIDLSDRSGGTLLTKPEFFTQKDINFLASWAGKVYDKQNSEHIRAKNTIMNSLGSKTVYWSEQLVAQLPGFEAFNWRMWSQRGWINTDQGKKQIARFKHYTWARIYKVGDAYKDIFFTVGADANHKSLVYKLDYYFENDSSLSKSQKELCAQLIPDEVSWMEVPFDEIADYSWDKLVEKTIGFIRDNESLYNEIMESVWNETINVSKLKNRLIKRDAPDDGIDEIPTRTFSFQGVDIDWAGQNEEFTEIGKIGEELVIEYEKRKLNEQGMADFAKEVRKMKDGEGYDIFSRNFDGTEKKIEVKTTTQNSNAPFPISLPEVRFSELNHKSYTLYRVFNLDRKKKVAEFHEYKGDLKQHFLLEPMQYNAHKKRRN